MAPPVVGKCGQIAPTSIMPTRRYCDRKLTNICGRISQTEPERRTTEVARRVLAGQRRALSIRRPWANLIFADKTAKTVENRSWSTTHRGPLVVHAGHAWAPDGAVLATELGISGFDVAIACPAGYLGTVRLVDVHPDAGCCAPWGQHDPGTYHWVLADPQRFDQPIPGRGRLGLCWLPADLLRGA